MKYFKKVSDLFVMWEAPKGNKHWGVMIQSNKTETECKQQGLQYEWKCNTYTLNAQSNEELKLIGFNEDEIKFIREVEEERLRLFP